MVTFVCLNFASLDVNECHLLRGSAKQVEHSGKGAGDGSEDDNEEDDGKWIIVDTKDLPNSSNVMM